MYSTCKWYLVDRFTDHFQRRVDSGMLFHTCPPFRGVGADQLAPRFPSYRGQLTHGSLGAGHYRINGSFGPFLPALDRSLVAVDVL
jgi:hypothetical protein